MDYGQQITDSQVLPGTTHYLKDTIKGQIWLQWMNLKITGVNSNRGLYIHSEYD